MHENLRRERTNWTREYMIYFVSSVHLSFIEEKVV
jgi:hypothetical protein